jgi:hypothetical protein
MDNEDIEYRLYQRLDTLHTQYKDQQQHFDLYEDWLINNDEKTRQWERIALKRYNKHRDMQVTLAQIEVLEELIIF